MKNPQNASRPASAISSEAVSREAKIGELELEIKRLRRLGRTKREPVAGIGGTIQRLREQRAIGLRELATACDMSAGNISRIEQEPNANPTLELLEKFARGLKLKLSDMILAYEKEQPQNDQALRPLGASEEPRSGSANSRNCRDCNHCGQPAGPYIRCEHPALVASCEPDAHDMREFAPDFAQECDDFENGKLGGRPRKPRLKTQAQARAQAEPRAPSAQARAR